MSFSRLALICFSVVSFTLAACTNALTEAITSQTPSSIYTPIPTWTPTPLEPTETGNPANCLQQLPDKFAEEPWFDKYCDAEGIPILASANVDAEAVRRARDVLVNMFSKIPEYRHLLMSDDVKVVIYDNNEEQISDVPGYCTLGAADLYGKYCDETRTVITWEKDLFRETCGQYTIHEMAHALEIRIMRERDTKLEKQLVYVYEVAKAQGIWPDYYAMTKASEYWATGVMAYFDAGWDHWVEEVVEKSELRSDLYELIDGFFSQTNWIATCPE